MLSGLINGTDVDLPKLSLQAFNFTTDYFKNIGITDYGTFQGKQGGDDDYIPMN